MARRREVLTLDTAEIGDPVDRITETRKQGKARIALVRLRVIDGDLFEEAVDGRAQGGERGHGVSELLALDRGSGTRGRGSPRAGS